MDFRRVLLFFALSILSIYLYGQLVRSVYGPGVQREGGDEVAGRLPPPALAPPLERVTGETRVAKKRLVGRVVVVETDLYRAEWTTAGARLKSLELRRYRTTIANESAPMDLVALAPVDDLPVGVEIPALGFSDAGVLYDVDRHELNLTGDLVGTIVFRGSGPEGIVIEKEITFRGDQYPMDLVVRARTVGGVTPGTVAVTLTREAEVSSSDGGWFSGGGRQHFQGLTVLNGRRLEQEPLETLEGEALVFDEPQWGGFGDQYFVTLGVIGNTQGARIVAPQIQKNEPAKVRIEVPVGESREARFMLYFGPKEVNILEAAAPNLRRAIDFGIFWFIALPLLRLIKLVHLLTGNYGLDIIAVSSLIKILFIPLSMKSMQSMQAMQKLQPQMAKIRERYKDDSQQLQKEMMELYKRHHVNPLSGCLPMLLQIPVFIGLYNTLLNAIELRHAPFLLWIIDLSSPERLVVAGLPIPVLAITMGLSMLVQQWMTPATGDLTQRRMMMLMPVIFTFMFINFPSGLVLYWLVNNLLTIVQQYFLVNRTARP